MIYSYDFSPDDLYAMYLRKSRADMELEAISHEETLARHKADLFALAERYGIPADRIVLYHEIVSGDSIEARPEMQRLLVDVYAKKYRAVFVMEIERLSRGNTRDQAEVSEAFYLSHTYIITKQKIYNPDDDADQDYFELGLLFSRREYKTIKRRLAAGKEAAVSEGNYILSHPPYGYDIVKYSKKNRTLEENQETGEILRDIFHMWADEGLSTTQIARTLSRRGIPTPSGGKEWSSGTITDMLRNRTYTGFVCWGRERSIQCKDAATGKTRTKTVRTGQPTWYPGKHKPLISDELFQRAQDRFGQLPPSHTGAVLRNPLAGLLYCAHCNQAIAHIAYAEHSDKRRGHYSSRYYHKGGVYACKVKSVSEQALLAALVDGLNRAAEEYTTLLHSGSNDNAKALEQAMETTRAEIAKTNRMKQRLFDSWEADDGMYTREEFLERKQLYSSRIQQLTEYLESLERTIPLQINYTERISTVHRLIDCIDDPNISAADKNRFLKQFISKITFASIPRPHACGATPILEITLK